MLQSRLPGTWREGVNFALWLDAERLAEFKSVGVPLMNLRIQYAIRHQALTGVVWTVIRPQNHAALAAWEYSEYQWGGFHSYASPGDYGEIDGIHDLRQLYVSNQTLQTLRG